MVCQRQSKKLINNVHERALRPIYQNNSNFKVLLENTKRIFDSSKQFAGFNNWNLKNIKWYSAIYNEVPISVSHISI